MNDSSNNTRQGSGSRWTPPQPVDSAGKDDIDLREVAAFLWNGKRFIAAVTAGVSILAVLYAFLASPVYEANALIQIEQQNQTPSGASSDVLSMLLPIAAPADTEIQIMNSRAVLRPTVEKEHLNIQVDGDGLLSRGAVAKKVTISKLQVPDSWKDQKLSLHAEGDGHYMLESPDGQKVLTGKVGALASAEHGAINIMVDKLALDKGTSVSVTRLFDQEAIAGLKRDLTVAEQGKDTGIIQITLQGNDRVLVRNLVNAMANAYIKQNVAAMATQAQQSLAFVKKQLPQLKQQLETAQSRLTNYQAQHAAFALDEQAKSLLQQLTALEGQLTQLQLAESAVRQRYTGNYPARKGLRNQEQDIRKQIIAVQAQIKRLPSQEQGYLRLMQEVQVDQQLYSALLAKAQDLQIGAASTVGSARVVDYAVMPIKPVKPRKALVVAVGLIVGLFLGVLVVFLRQALGRSVQDAAELEGEFGLPVYAIVPHSDRQADLVKRAKRDPSGKIALLAEDDPGDPAIEAIRSLHTSINFVLQDNSRKVIAVGGCAAGVGKSFLSMNLAHVINASGARVLLIDADMRRGHLKEYVDAPVDRGLSQVLSGELSPEEAIVPSSPRDNLDLLGTGPYPPNPYELMAGPRFEPLLAALSERYDVVILDLPPVLAVAEGLLAARLATVNLFVIKAGIDTLQEVRLANDRMLQNGVRLNGFVYNDLAREAAVYTYGSNVRSYYYTRYGEKRR